MPHPQEDAFRVIDTLYERPRSDVRAVLDRRVAAMIRHLDYLEAAEVDTYELVRETGWTPAMLASVVGLNSFYQVVLSPLSSWARDDSPAGLVDDFPVSYGTRLRFDRGSRVRVRIMMSEFWSLVGESGIPAVAVEANQADDLVQALLPDVDFER